MVDPAVSVVMAAWNGELYIKEQIDSILNQLRPADELIISLDPSTDRTEKIIRSYVDDRICLLPGPGRGVVANFENGLKHVHNDIIFLSDQDDVWNPEKVENVLQTFVKTGADLVLHDNEIVDENLNLQESSYFTFHGTKTGFWQNILRNSFMGCCMAFRRAILDEALPFPSRVPMHDQWLGLTASRTGKVVLLNQPLLKYRRHRNNQTDLQHSSFGEMIRWRFNVLLSLKERGLL